MAGTAHSRSEQHGGSHIILLLSLNLILLAFFILLNALSDFEETRTRAVIDSVNRAFSGRVDAAEAPPVRQSSLGALPETASLLREIGSLFESIIPAAQTEENQKATLIRIRLPQTALFASGEAVVRPARRALIQRLAKALLRSPNERVTYRLEALLGVSAESGSAGRDRPLEMRRAGALAARFVAEGLTPESLSTGLLPGAAGTMQFVLRVEESAESNRSAPDDQE
jgi:outer membrane protein OmpA-like peptidoglycan-associated protein